MAFTGSLRVSLQLVSLHPCMPGRGPRPPPGPPPGWRAPLPPGPPPPGRVPPWRRRSRSPLRERQGAVLEAHWRNLESRHGGRQGRARTRGIHRHFLSLLKQRIGRLLSVLAPGSQRAEAWSLRVQQIDERTRFLNNDWPEDKHIVLPGLRVGG